MTFTTIGLFHRCFTSGIELILTEVGKNDAGISEIPLCDKCKEQNKRPSSNKRHVFSLFYSSIICVQHQKLVVLSQA